MKPICLAILIAVVASLSQAADLCTQPVTYGCLDTSGSSYPAPCYDFFAAGDASHNQCDDPKGFLVNGCPKDHSMGRCALPSWGTVLNYYEPHDPADLARDCYRLNGTLCAP